MQLSIEEIDQIISFLQEPYPYQLIKRLEQLKAETAFNIQIHNQKIMYKLDEEKQIQENGLGSSPIKNAYFKIVEY